MSGNFNLTVHQENSGYDHDQKKKIWSFWQWKKIMRKSILKGCSKQISRGASGFSSTQTILLTTKQSNKLFNLTAYMLNMFTRIKWHNKKTIIRLGESRRGHVTYFAIILFMGAWVSLGLTEVESIIVLMNA